MAKRKTAILLVAAMLAQVSAGPAAATSSISCTATDGSAAALDMGIGNLPILAPISLRVISGSTVWSMQPAKGEIEVVPGDRAALDGGLIATFTDPNIEKVLVKIHLLREESETATASAGILALPEAGLVHPLVCEGP